LVAVGEYAADREDLVCSLRRCAFALPTRTDQLVVLFINAGAHGAQTARAA